MAGRIGSNLQSTPAITCVKILLTAFNVIFWVSGVAILGLGLWMKMKLFLYMELTTVYFDAAPYILIGVGSGILIVGSFGCLCTFRGHSCLLYLYSLILLLVFIVELSTAVSAFVYRAKLEDGFSSGLNTAMQEYHTDADKRQAVDGIQTGLKCCGREKFEEWYSIDWTGNGYARKVPSSCCIQKPCAGTDETNIYQEGCFKKLSTFMHSNFTLIGGVAIGFAFLQLFGALLSCCLAKNINKAKYEQMA